MMRHTPGFNRVKIAALPPDVREVSDLPLGLPRNSLGLRPYLIGHSPKGGDPATRKGTALPHIRRQSRRNIGSLASGLKRACFILLLCLSPLAARAQTPRFAAGVARADITPPPGVELWGYSN